MTTLSSQVAYVRAQSELFMIDQCVIKHYVGITNVDGAYEDQFTVASGIPCRLINKIGTTVVNTSEQKDEVQLTLSTQSTKIQLPYTLDVTVKDIIVFNGAEFGIVDVPVKHSMMGAFVVTVQARA